MNDHSPVSIIASLWKQERFSFKVKTMLYSNLLSYTSSLTQDGLISDHQCVCFKPYFFFVCLFVSFFSFSHFCVFMEKYINVCVLGPPGV